MSYTDYLNRMAINRPKVIDTQMRLPDASSFTWRTKLAATNVNRRTDHIINNVQDPSTTPTLNSKSIMSYVGTGFGGKVQDASSYTMSLGARSVGQDDFSSGKIITSGVNSSGRCLASTPASQVVSENGNADGSIRGLNMGYTAQVTPTGTIANVVGTCTQTYNPQAKSYFVDTIPDVKFHKSGTAPEVGVQTAGGLQNVQNPINCVTTNTSGAQGVKAIQPYNSYSARPYNHATALFVTSPTGPQGGGGDTFGSRAPKVGGAVPPVKHAITHRGWGGRNRTNIPYPRVPPTGAPAQLKINDPNHYKM